MALLFDSMWQSFSLFNYSFIKMTVIIGLKPVLTFLLEFYIKCFFIFNIFIPNIYLSTLLVLCLYLNELHSYLILTILPLNMFWLLFFFWLSLLVLAGIHFQLLWPKGLYLWMPYFLNCPALEIADISRKAGVWHASVLAKLKFFHLSPFPCPWRWL